MIGERQEGASGTHVNEAERRRWNDDRWTSAWPKRELLTAHLTPYLLAALDWRPGERVLDVGSGGGRSTIAAAQLVGPSGSAVGADISEPLVRLARGRAEEAGVRNVTFVVADLQTDRVEGAGSFDGAMSQLGVMFFDDPVAAFANVAAHVRPGGRLGFACWQPLERNEWFIGPALTPFLTAPGPSAPGPASPGPFSLGQADTVVEILTAAGWDDVGRAEHELVIELPRSALVDDAQLENMGVPAESMGAARAAVAEYLDRLETAAGTLRFSIAFSVVTGRRVPA